MVQIEGNELVGRARALRYLDYVDLIGVGELVSRDDVAGRMGCPYSTALYNLERAVSEGALNKMYGIINVQPGWLYALPVTMPRLEGM